MQVQCKDCLQEYKISSSTIRRYLNGWICKQCRTKKVKIEKHLRKSGLDPRLSTVRSAQSDQIFKQLKSLPTREQLFILNLTKSRILQEERDARNSG